MLPFRNLPGVFFRSAGCKNGGMSSLSIITAARLVARLASEWVAFRVADDDTATVVLPAELWRAVLEEAKCLR